MDFVEIESDDDDIYTENEEACDIEELDDIKVEI